jgi:hypothetical protein
MVEGMDNCNVETETNKGSYKIKCTSAKSKDEGVVLKNLILSLKNTPDIKLGIKCLLLPPNTILKDKKK